MGSFTQLVDRFRKSGSGSASRQGGFEPLPYPTPPTFPVTSPPEATPLFSRDRLIAGAIGAAAATSICLLGVGLAAGSGETTPQPAAAYSAPEPASRDAAPQPAPPGQFAVDEPAGAPAPPVEPAPAAIGEPVLAPVGEPAPVPPIEPAPAPMADPAPAQPAPAPIAEPVPAPQPVQEYVPAVADTYYANCTQVRAAGVAPIHQGSPGYGTHLDRDGDGIGCDK